MTKHAFWTASFQCLAKSLPYLMISCWIEDSLGKLKHSTA